MNNSNIRYLANTKFGKDSTSLNRMQCTLKTLERMRKLRIPSTIIDGGSECQAFILHLKDLSQTSNNFDIIFLEKCETYGEQIRESFRYCLENPKYREEYTLRFEPEKTGLLSDENLNHINQSIGENEGDFEYISYSREDAKNMPESQRSSEDKLARYINSSLKRLGIDFSDFYMGSKELTEGPGTLFGPILATREGVERIINSKPVTLRDGNELLVLNIIKAIIDGQNGKGKGVISQALDFSYNEKLELIPEEQELEEIKKLKCAGENFSFKRYKKINPHSLIVKRFETYKFIFEALKKEIGKYH